MSIVPASRLSASDLAMLGNNLADVPRPRGGGNRSRRVGRRRAVAYRGELAAVNRSLATVGEQIGRLTATPSVIELAAEA